MRRIIEARCADGSMRRSVYNDQTDDIQSTDAFGNQVKLKRNTSDNFINYGFVYDSNSTRLLKRGGYGGNACNFPMQDTLSQGYDLAGHLTGTTYTSWGGYQCPTIQTGWPITSWSTTDNHYASNGQLTWSKRGTSEDVHRTDKVFLKTYGYTKLVADPSLGRGVYQENRYDALGRRVWVRELRNRYCTVADQSATSECLGAVMRTIWDGDRVLYEIRQPGDSGTAAATMESDAASTAHNAFYGIAEYTHGDDLDEPLGMIRDTSGVMTLVLHHQWRGQVDQSTWAVGGAKADCPSTGQMGCVKVNWPGADVLIDYSRPPTDSGPPSWMGSLTQGMRDATHQLYMRNRYYDPITGRFTQEDPIGLAGGLNVYGFASGDPVNYSDPFGLCPPKDNNPCSLLQQAVRKLAPDNKRLNDFVDKFTDVTNRVDKFMNAVGLGDGECHNGVCEAGVGGGFGGPLGEGEAQPALRAIARSENPLEDHP